MAVARIALCAFVSLAFPLAPAAAEERLSTSTDPTAVIVPLDAQLVTLLSHERDALGRVASRIRAATRAPRARPSHWPERIDAAWLAAQPVPQGDAQFECLAKALYFEARGEPVAGQVAVAEVVLNRVDSPRYPSTVCKVVNQARLGSCQFSFMCDGKAETVDDRKAWNRAAKIARVMIDGAPRRLTGGATHFHADFVEPFWARKFAKTAEIGGHLFYRPDRATARP
ncbi:MAG: cell wall hydrolase [Rhodobacteraceae bacterium]|nr:cell wall hydrolase [Paracoccaceae bacterium]